MLPTAVQPDPHLEERDVQGKCTVAKGRMEVCCQVQAKCTTKILTSLQVQLNNGHPARGTICKHKLQIHARGGQQQVSEASGWREGESTCLKRAARPLASDRARSRMLGPTPDSRSVGRP